MSDSRLNYLFNKYFDKTASPEERAEFMNYIVKLKSDDPLLILMEEAYKSDHSVLTAFTPEVRDRILANVFLGDQAKETMPARVVKLNPFKRSWVKYAAAIIVIAIGTVLYIHNNETKNIFTYTKHDITPGGQKATLTLGNGDKIVLDGAKNGLLASQGNISISKTEDGQLIYDVKGDDGGIVSINSIETPNGGQYQINLPDGTKVWLNAASILKYPTQFTGTDRKVELSGEAYFEVAKNAHKPFKVKMKDDLEVLVLGTHFNVNTYKEEKTINTTLLEGSVAIKSGKNQKNIIPGQQAQVDKNDQLIKITDDVNLDNVIAWKNGYFRTDGLSLEILMSQIERWYDVDIVYKDRPNAQFVAKLPRNVPLSEVLKLLEMTKQIHFKLEGKTLIVMK